MGLGLVGAYGWGGATDALHQIEADRLLKTALAKKAQETAEASAYQRMVDERKEQREAAAAKTKGFVDRKKAVEDTISAWRTQAQTRAATDKTRQETGLAAKAATEKDAAIAEMAPEMRRIIRAGIAGNVDPTDPTDERKQRNLIEIHRLDNAAADARAERAARIASDRRLSMTPAQAASETRALNEQYAKRTETSRGVIGAHRDMVTALEEARRSGSLNAASNVIINNFLKTLDPRSAVMQGEFVRVGQGQSLYQSLLGRAESLAKGGPNLTEKSLQEFTDMSARLAERAKTYNARERDRIGSVADDFGLRKQHIFTADDPEDRPTPAENKPAPGVAKIGQRVQDNQTGEIFVVRGYDKNGQPVK